MALIRDKDTGSVIRIDSDTEKFYAEEIAAGEISGRHMSDAEATPGWVSTKVIQKSPPPSWTDEFYGLTAGTAFVVEVNGERRRTGIITGFDLRASDIEHVRVVALQDVGKRGVSEVAYPFDLVVHGRGGLRIRIEGTGSPLLGMNRIFTVSKQIERAHK